MQLRSGVAVAMMEASSCSSDSTPSLGTSICHRCGPKESKNKTKQNNPKRPWSKSYRNQSAVLDNTQFSGQK